MLRSLSIPMESLYKGQITVFISQLLLHAGRSWDSFLVCVWKDGRTICNPVSFVKEPISSGALSFSSPVVKHKVECHKRYQPDRDGRYHTLP